MVVRELKWSDFRDLTDNYWALYEEVRDDPEMGISLFPTRPTLGEEAEWFAALFRRVDEGNSVAAVAEEDGRAVGLCNVDRKGTTVESAHLGVLGIMIARGYRDRGLGRQLMSYVLQRCQPRFEIVELVVFATNARGIHLYESLGFRSWGVQRRVVRRGERFIDLVHMQLDFLAKKPEPPA